MTISLWAICPACLTVGDVDAFDSIGADDGCVFCTHCGNEFHAPNIIPQPEDKPEDHTQLTLGI